MEFYGGIICGPAVLITINRLMSAAGSLAHNFAGGGVLVTWLSIKNGRRVCDKLSGCGKIVSNFFPKNDSYGDRDNQRGFVDGFGRSRVVHQTDHKTMFHMKKTFLLRKCSDLLEFDV